MREFDRIKDMVYCELDEISNQGQLDMNTIKILGDLADILKDLGQVEMFEEGINIQDEGYSYSNSYRNGNMNNGYSQKRMPIYYNDGNSYRNGNQYSRRGRGYSYDDSKTHMINKLHNLMTEAQDQNDKEAIQRLIDQMENN